MRSALVLPFLTLFSLCSLACGGSSDSKTPEEKQDDTGNEQKKPDSKSPEDQKGPEEGPLNHRASCERFCTQAASCSDVPPDENCADSCEQTRIFNEALQAEFFACYAEYGCDSDSTEGLVACLQDVLERVPTTPEAEEFCDSSLTQLLSCSPGAALPFPEDELTESQTACTQAASVLNQALVRKINRCLNSQDQCDTDAQSCMALSLLQHVDVSILQEGGVESNAFFQLLQQVFTDLGEGMLPPGSR